LTAISMVISQAPCRLLLMVGTALRAVTRSGPVE
jgi:hypothetical protein